MKSADFIDRVNIDRLTAENSDRITPAATDMDGRCLYLVSFLACSLAANGQDRSREAGNRVTAPSSSAKGVSVLVLIDYEVVRGKCTPRPDGYDVDVTSGRMFIDSARIRIAAKDLEDAYIQLRRSQVSTTPESHMQLARWCLNNGMKEFAELEVLDALRRDPNRTDAKRLLSTLRQSENTGGNSSSGLTEYSAPKRPAMNIESRSLAGLSRPVSREFTARVQPILKNNCSAAGCHGSSSTSEFRLSFSVHGSNPVSSERNLAAVLKQVDLTRPSSSPLLLVLDGTHGGQAGSMFRGRAGSIQMKVLRDWVQSAAADIAPEANLEVKERKEAIEAARRKSMLTAIREASERPDPYQAFARSTDVVGGMESTHGQLKSIDETDREFLAEADRTNVTDAFSPSAFNRKYHGTESPADTADAEHNDTLTEPSPSDE